MSEYNLGKQVVIIDANHARYCEPAKIVGIGNESVKIRFDNGDETVAAYEIIQPASVAGEMKPAPTPHPTRSTTLTTADELINGDRAATYGDPAENFGRIAQLWNAQFGHKLSAKFTASDVALALVHLKLSRLAVTPDHADSWIDGCGYLALGSEIASK